MAISEKLNDRNNLRGRKNSKNAFIPFSSQKVESPGAGRENGQNQYLNGVPRLTLPTKSIDQWPTLVDLRAVYVTSPSFNMDVLPIDQQPTLLLKPVKLRSEGEQSSSESYFILIRKLVKSSGIYALASFVSPLISLVLAPFLTRNLSHADYGALTIFITVIALVAGITQLGLNNAFFRAYSCDYESEGDRLSIVSTVVILLSLSTIPITMTAILGATWISSALFGTPSYTDSVKLAASVILLQNLTVPGLSWLRAENKAILFSILSIGNLLTSLGLNFVLVGVLHMGIAGSLIATGGGYACIVIFSLPAILLRTGFRLRLDIARNLLSFGIPLVSNFISVWVLQLSDRYLLSRYGSLSQTASYSVAYTLGGVLGILVLTPFSLAWPTAMFAIAKRKDAAKVFQLVFRWFSIFLLFAAYGLSLVSTALLFILFPPAYHSAAPVVPIVAMSIMFYGVFNVFTIGISIQRKTWYAVVFTTLAALVNVGANIILIPLYGSMGAAASTLIAYALLAIVTYVLNQRIYPIPFEIGKFMIALLIGIALYVGVAILTQAQGLNVTLGVSLGVFGLYAGCLWLIGKLPVRRESHIQIREVSVV